MDFNTKTRCTHIEELYCSRIYKFNILESKKDNTLFIYFDCRHDGERKWTYFFFTFGVHFLYVHIFYQLDLRVTMLNLCSRDVQLQHYGLTGWRDFKRVFLFFWGGFCGRRSRWDEEPWDIRYFAWNSSCQLFSVTEVYIFSSAFSDQNWEQGFLVLRGKHTWSYIIISPSGEWCTD